MRNPKVAKFVDFLQNFWTFTICSNFVQNFGISYPVLVGEADVFEVSAAYGNAEGVLPYSVLIDSEGIIRWQYAGKLRHDELTRRLNEFL